MFTDCHSIKVYHPITNIYTYIQLSFHFAVLSLALDTFYVTDDIQRSIRFHQKQIYPFYFLPAHREAPQELTDNLTTFANTTFKFVEKNWKTQQDDAWRLLN